MDLEKNKTCFIVASDDFGEHPSSLQHLVRRFPKRYPVVWINTIGMRNPKFTARDLGKIFLKGKKMLKTILGGSRITPNVPGNIFISQPPMLPFSGFPPFRELNKKLVCSSVRKILGELPGGNRIFIITAPNACDYIGELGEKKVVYYCVDDFSEWPGVKKTLVKSMQEELAEKSDVLIAVSEKLSHMLDSGEKPVHLITHGVDLEHFSNATLKNHPLLADIPEPRLGYFGLFDERTDQDLIRGIARRLPEYSFVVTGNIEADSRGLEMEKNIYFTGPVPYSELPMVARGWEMCLLPYKINRLTDAIQPLKLKEYLATGKPVLSTPIKEALKLKEFILIGETIESWVNHIRTHSGTWREGRAVRDSYLREESWEKKAEKFLSLCLE